MDDAARREVVRRAMAGETLTGLAAEFGVTRQAIRGLLNRRGVPPRRTGKLTDEQHVEVVLLYSSGWNLEQLARYYGVAAPSIRGLLSRRGVEIRKPVHTLRHDAFDALTPRAMYWAGFLFADGCVNFRRGFAPQVGVALAERDREQLVALRDFLGSTHAISTQGLRGGSVQFSVRSETLANRLLALGRYSDQISTELVGSRDFWRGVSDGDGSMGCYRVAGRRRLMLQFRLVGRRSLLEPFVGFLNEQGVTRLSVRPHKSISVVGTTGRQAVKIVEVLYLNASPVLARKAERAQALLAEARSSHEAERPGSGR
jgi:hypothetical protein